MDLQHRGTGPSHIAQDVAEVEGGERLLTARSPSSVILKHPGEVAAEGEQNLRLAPLARGLTGLAGVFTRPASYLSGGVPPATERQLHSPRH